MHITRAQKIEGTNNYFRPDVSNILEKMSKLKGKTVNEIPKMLI